MPKAISRRTYRGGTNNPKSPNLGLRLPEPVITAVRELSMEENRSLNAQGIRITKAGLAAMGKPVE